MKSVHCRILAPGLGVHYDGEDTTLYNTSGVNSHPIIVLDDEEMRGLIEWYQGDRCPEPLQAPEVKALIDAAQALLDTARADYEGTDWRVDQWITDEPTVAALDAALHPFQEPSDYEGVSP